MPDSQTTSVLPVLGRIAWMILGPLALLGAIGGIVAEGGGWFTPVDFAYFAFVAAMLLGRWLEFRGDNPQKSTGEPATREDLRRYFLLTPVVCLVIWVVANIAGNQWLAR